MCADKGKLTLGSGMADGLNVLTGETQATNTWPHSLLLQTKVTSRYKLEICSVLRVVHRSLQ